MFNELIILSLMWIIPKLKLKNNSNEIQYKL